MTGADALFSRFDPVLRAGGADEIEISFIGQERGTSRFANNGLTQCMEVNDRTARVRVALGKRLGGAQTDDLSPEALERCVRLAVDIAAAAPEHPDFHGFPVAASTTAGSPAISTAAPDERASRLGPLFDRARGRALTLAGCSSSMLSEVAVANSRGVRAHASRGAAKLEIIASGPDSSGYASAFAADLSSIDEASLFEVACEKAERASGAVSLPPGEYDVVLEPAAIAEVLEWLGLTAFSAKAAQDGTSFLCGRIGQPTLSEMLTIVDDATTSHASHAPMPFDCEGVPKRRVELVDRGVPRGWVHDSLSAARDGLQSTGHAAPIGDDMSDGPASADLVIGAGDRSLDEMVASVDRGLLVTRFHYVNGLLDPPRAMMTGLTRDGLLLIEGGKIRGGVRNLRWTQSILEAFARIRAVGRERRAVPTWWSNLGAFVCPAMLVERWKFTGQSR